MMLNSIANLQSSVCLFLIKDVRTFGLVIGLLVLISSCHTPDDVKDTTAPNVTLKLPRTGTYFHHTILIQAIATDNKKIKKIELYADGTFVSDGTDALLNYSWDTKSVSDGKHTIRAIAYDAENNSSESELVVNVMNTLYEVVIKGVYVDEFTTIWILLSDQKGNPLVYKKLENDKDIVFETPVGFVDSTFTITTITKRDYRPTFPISWTISSSLPGQKPGQVERHEIGQGTNPSSAPLSVTVNANYSVESCVFTGTGLYFYGRGDGNAETYGVKTNFLVPSDLLILTRMNDGHAYYKYYASLNNNDNITASLTDFTLAQQMKITFAQMSQVILTFSGIRNNASYYLGEIGKPNTVTTSVDVFYPGDNFFDKYDLEIDGNLNNAWYTFKFTGISSFPDKLTEIKSAVTSAALNGGILNYQINNQNDFNSISLKGVNGMSSWSLQVTPGVLSVVIPTIPADLQSTSGMPPYTDFTFNGYTVGQQGDFSKVTKASTF